MGEYMYIRIPFLIPKYWALQGRYDERYTKPFKVHVPQNEQGKDE